MAIGCCGSVRDYALFFAVQVRGDAHFLPLRSSVGTNTSRRLQTPSQPPTTITHFQWEVTLFGLP